MMNLVVAVLLLVAVASQVYPWITVRWVTPEELRRWLEDADGLALVVADVRRPTEYATGHIPGAVSVPIIRIRQMSRVWTPTTRIVLVDRAGYRALQAYQSLRRRGFRDVWCLKGGMLGWARFTLREQDRRPAVDGGAR
jgi:rhodanese-related sulfurtransferase